MVPSYSAMRSTSKDFSRQGSPTTIGVLQGLCGLYVREGKAGWAAPHLKDAVLSLDRLREGYGGDDYCNADTISEVQTGAWRPQRV
ncbi:uncharacterized protein LOC122311521 isoform X3 [Carya illinoinensis]|uniref:uncharacterized protein LOC122311521 isoform X3 n=1 Tax=Carya illinoinensis TaxID=32201 RepID=UPI001C71933D|nr:uncharacterized protein LOC122311521 isoform X3 [Carya illinoinensis]XP_042982036.1 uncharacterized protein LOC122311521 isoform X3 [Carya illinoinensis]